MRAVEAASDELYRGSVPETTPEQRRADALVLLVERALAVGLGRGGSAEPGDDPDPRDGENGPEGGSAEPGADGNGPDQEPRGGSAEQAAATEMVGKETGGGSDRYMVVLHVDGDRLSGAAAGSPESASDPLHTHRAPHLEDGTRLAADTARRIACDASVLRVVHRKGRRLVEIQGKRRQVPLRLRRALELRDRGCRFPGCGSRFTEVHHIHHWADGGATTLENTTLLCRTHHRLLHEGGFGLEADPRRPGRPVFYDPRGYRIPDVPPEMTINRKPVGRRREAPPGEKGGRSGALAPGANGPEAPAGRRRPHRRPRWEHDVPLAFYLRAIDRLCR